MAGDAVAAEPSLRVGGDSWRSAAAFALLVGLGALFIGGAVMGLVGVGAGFAAARRPQAVLISAAVALCAAALLTVFEEPLTTAGVPFFPENRPLAQLAGKLAAVLLLAGLAGTFVRGERSPSAQSLPHRAGGPAAEGTLRDRVSSSTIAAALAATLVGALSLLSLGDQVWRPEAFGLVGVVLILMGVLLVTHRR